MLTTIILSVKATVNWKADNDNSQRVLHIPVIRPVAPS